VQVEKAFGVDPSLITLNFSGPKDVQSLEDDG